MESWSKVTLSDADIAASRLAELQNTFEVSVFGRFAAVCNFPKASFWNTDIDLVLGVGTNLTPAPSVFFEDLKPTEPFLVPLKIAHADFFNRPAGGTKLRCHRSKMEQPTNKNNSAYPEFADF